MKTPKDKIIHNCQLECCRQLSADSTLSRMTKPRSRTGSTYSWKRKSGSRRRLKRQGLKRRRSRSKGSITRTTTSKSSEDKSQKKKHGSKGSITTTLSRPCRRNAFNRLNWQPSKWNSPKSMNWSDREMDWSKSFTRHQWIVSLTKFKEPARSEEKTTAQDWIVWTTSNLELKPPEATLPTNAQTLNCKANKKKRIYKNWRSKKLKCSIGSRTLNTRN